MRILIVTPAPRGSRKGNRITAERWARLLRTAGHRVRIAEEYDDRPCDLMIALHARKSARSVLRAVGDEPRRPVIVALTGTDLYREIRTSAAARESLRLAARLVLLQPRGVNELPAALRAKARVIYQSAEIPPGPGAPDASRFDVCVLSHLRAVKDPLRAALAVRRLPAASRIQVVHCGAALDCRLEQRARREMERNDRYRWLGDVPRPRALRLLAGSRALVLTSRLEGGANVISEALAAGVPVLSSRISGSVGLLGEKYPGYFEVGDTLGLSDLLRRFESDEPFRRSVQNHCRGLRRLVDPAGERRRWESLIDEFLPGR